MKLSNGIFLHLVDCGLFHTPVKGKYYFFLQAKRWHSGCLPEMSMCSFFLRCFNVTQCATQMDPQAKAWVMNSTIDYVFLPVEYTCNCTKCICFTYKIVAFCDSFIVVFFSLCEIIENHRYATILHTIKKHPNKKCIECIMCHCFLMFV